MLRGNLHLKRYKEELIYSLQGTRLLTWPLRKLIMSWMGSKFGEKNVIEHGSLIRKAKLNIGDEVYINRFLLVEGEGTVTIGSNVRIGPRCTFIVSDHKILKTSSPRIDFMPDHYPIEIGDGCWLAAAVIVLPNVKIAKGCVIGAGSVVTRSTEPDGLYVGVPAKRIRDL